jgi:serine protease Do
MGGGVVLKKKHFGSIVVCLVLILTTLLGIACGQPQSENVSGSAEALAGSQSTASVQTAWSTTLAGGSVLPSIADVVASVKPSVVTIDTETTYRVFYRTYTQEGAGSGWIFGEDGLIVTNYHVVADAETIIVTLDDGRTFTVDPRAVSADPASDIAVLKIDATDLPAARIGDSTDLRVGDWLVAIGNPLGLGISAKEGIASRLGVSLSVGGQTVEGLIETSAAINPGNSGGPLVNMQGEVVGITSAKVSSVGVEGLGYAISIDEAEPIIEALIGSS